MTRSEAMMLAASACAVTGNTYFVVQHEHDVFSVYDQISFDMLEKYDENIIVAKKYTGTKKGGERS